MAGGGTPIGTFGIIPWPIAMPIGAKRPEEKKNNTTISKEQQSAHAQKLPRTKNMKRNQVSRECMK
jgi:hypothetical protein